MARWPQGSLLVTGTWQGAHSSPHLLGHPCSASLQTRLLHGCSHCACSWLGWWHASPHTCPHASTSEHVSPHTGVCPHLARAVCPHGSGVSTVSVHTRVSARAAS